MTTALMYGETYQNAQYKNNVHNIFRNMVIKEPSLDTIAQSPEQET